MITVFIDVENTLSVPFITGIQRVTREVCRLVCKPTFSSTFQFIPVVYDGQKQSWRRLTLGEQKELQSDAPRSMKLTARLLRRLRGLLPINPRLYLQISVAGNVFLDIDSSWHSSCSRTDLLPELDAAGVAIVKVHYDIIPIKSPNTTHPDTLGIFLSHFESHLKHARLFLNISATTQKDLIDYCEQNHFTKPPSRTIRLGSEVQPAKTRPEGDNSDLMRKRFGQFLLCVGTIEPRKNHLTLLKSFDKLRKQTQLNLVIVGKEGWNSKEVLSLLNDKQYTLDRVYYLGAQSDEALDKLYRSAWLCVVPSIYEGFGLPVVEALSRGCPTISSNGGSLAEIAPRTTQKFSPTSVTELEQQILSLYQDETRYLDLKAKATNYTPTPWEVTARDIEDSLHSMIGA